MEYFETVERFLAAVPTNQDGLNPPETVRRLNAMYERLPRRGGYVSFQGQNLDGKDFSGLHMPSADFGKAKGTNVNFYRTYALSEE
jgi:hypothetical protein